jgi:hypothetical protein
VKIKLLILGAVAVAAFLLGFSSNAAFVEGSVVGIAKQSPTQQNPPIFVNSYTGTGPAADAWQTIDVSSIVPATTKAIRLEGILIITHGTTVESCDLTIAYKVNGTALDPGYIHQTVEASVSNGQRSTAGVWIALDPKKKFQFKWHRSTSGNWPDHCSYGINLSLTAYLR